MKYLSIIITLACVFSLFFSSESVYGNTDQEVHVSGSPNPVGAGARALGMGGAFIGVADDATAASWNPGGLIQLETPEISLVLSYENLGEKRTFETNPGASGTYELSLYDINYMSMAYPFTLSETNMIVSLNYQTMYNFNKEHQYNYHYQKFASTVANPGPPLVITREIKDSSQRQSSQVTDGYLKAFSPAMAFQWSPKFSVGIAINYFHPDLGSKWEMNYTDNYEGKKYDTVKRTLNNNPLPDIVTTYSVTGKSRYLNEYTFQTSMNPFNFDETSYHIGFLWNINSYLTLGGVYKPGFTAKVHFRESREREDHSVDDAAPFTESHSVSPWEVITNEDQQMDMPASYGLGLACRFTDQFSMDLDVYRTDWQDFVLRQADGTEISLITGQERSLANTEPTYQVRLGGEYLYLYKHKYAIPFRAGLFYDPEPTENDPDKFYGFSLGSGIAANRFAFDIAYQFRWGNGVRKTRLGTEEVFQDIQQHTVYASIIFYF